MLKAICQTTSLNLSFVIREERIRGEVRDVMEIWLVVNLALSLSHTIYVTFKKLILFNSNV